MKKIIVLLLLLSGTAYGTDVTGQGKSMRAQTDSLIDRVYDVGFAFTSTPYKLADTTLVMQALSWSADKAAKRFYIERDTSIVIVAGTEWYSLPSDFWKIPHFLPAFGVVSWGDDQGLGKAVGMQPMSINEVGLHRDLQGIPQYYLVQKFKLHVEPANKSNDSVKVFYAARSNIMDTITDSTSVDWEYLDFIVYDAVMTLYGAVNWGDYQPFADARLAEIKRARKEAVAIIENQKKSLLESMAK